MLNPARTGPYHFERHLPDAPHAGEDAPLGALLVRQRGGQGLRGGI